MSRTYPFQLLEVLPQKGDRIVRPNDAQLHDAVLQDALNLVRLDVGLALPQALLLFQQGRHNRSGDDFVVPPTGAAAAAASASTSTSAGLAGI